MSSSKHNIRKTFLTILIAVVSVFSSILFNYAMLSKSSYAAGGGLTYKFVVSDGNAFNDGEKEKSVSVSSLETKVVPDLSNSEQLAYGYYFSHWELFSVTDDSNNKKVEDSSAAEELFEGQSLPTSLKDNEDNKIENATLTYNAVFLKYSVTVNEEDCSITYTSSDDTSAKFTTKFTASLNKKLSEDRQNVLKFYQNTLDWNISSESGESGTIWYLPRTTEYNNGLPTLRAFLEFKEISLKIKVVNYNNEPLLNKQIGICSVPTDIKLPSVSEKKSTSYSFYGYTFSASPKGDVKFDVGEIEISNSSVTIVFKEVKENIAPKFVIVPLEFNQPTTAKDDGVTVTTEYGPNWVVDPTNVATKKNGKYTFKVYKNTEVKYTLSDEVHTFTFTALQKSNTTQSNTDTSQSEAGTTQSGAKYENVNVTVTLKDSEGCQLKEIGYTSANSNNNEYFYKTSSGNNSTKSESNPTKSLQVINGDEVITATYSVTTYSMSFGYTVKDTSERSNGNSISKSNQYKPNGPDGGSYQDVLVQLGSNIKLSVVGYTLPTDNNTLSSDDWFGADWSKLKTESSSFTCWLLDVTAIIELGYRQKDNDGRWYKGNYTNGRWVAGVYIYDGWTQNEDKSWVAFKYKDPAVTLNGRKSLYIEVSEIYGVGNFTSLISDAPATWQDSEHGYQGSYVMPLIPNWSRNYNVQIRNTLISNDDTSKTTYYSGVVDKSGNVNETVEFTINSGDTSKFVCSNGKAFYKSREIAEVIESGANYGIFKYGNDISGYTISFNYGGTTYYVTIDNKTWGTNKEPSTIDVKALEDYSFADLAKQLDTWTQGDYVFLGTNITITPVWKAATIDLYENKDDGSNLLKELTFGGKYKIEPKDVATGKSLAYYYYDYGENKAPENSVIVCNNGNNGEIVWDYLNIPSGKFEYDTKNKVYKLTLKRYEVDNVYKLTLTGLYGDEILAGAYSPADNPPAVNGDVLTYANWVTATYPSTTTNSVSNTTEEKDNFYNTVKAEAYANKFGADVKKYVDGIDDNSADYQLRTVYSSGNDKFIYVANDHTIGNLYYNKKYCELIAWRYNGNQGTTDFLLPNVDETKLTNKQNVKKYIDTVNWTYDTEETKQELFAMFYRESYKFNFDTIHATGTNGGFYGYLTVEVNDTVWKDNVGTLLSGKGNYLIVYVYNTEKKSYEKQIYKLDANLTSDEIAKKVEDLSTNFNDLILKMDGTTSTGETSALSENYVTIYGGCEIKVKVYDQSKISDLTKDNAFYDQMLGYRFNGLFTGAVEFGDQEIIPYEFNLDTKATQDNKTLLTYGTEDKDNISLTSGQEVKLNANFEPIIYSTSIKMALSTGGLIEITHATGDKTTTSSLYSLNNLQRGSKYEFFYYAYAGYGLNDPDFALALSNKTLVKLPSIAFDGSEVSRTTSTEKQTLYFQLGGAWLRQYMYGLHSNNNEIFTCSVDAKQNIEPIIVNNRLLEFDVKYYVFNQNNNDEAIATGDVLDVGKTWKLGETIAWNLPHEVITVGNENEILTYYYSSEGVKYAILSSWSYLPRSIANRSQYNQEYLFLLKDQPIHEFNIDTEHLFNMVQTTAGLIVPEENRTIYLAMQVVPMYEITLKIKADNANDTNCNTRTVTLTNGDNNSIVLSTTDNTKDTAAIGYTYLGLSNVLLASYDQDYYTGVKFIANQVELSSPFTISGDTIIFADFTPKELPINITYNYKGRVLDESEILNYFDSAVAVSEIKRGELNNITNNPHVSSCVVQNDTIILSYTLKTGYKVGFEVNSSQDRLSADNGIEVTSADYKNQGVNIRVLITDGQKGQIELKVVADNSNGAVFHEEDLQNMQSFVDLYIREGMQEKSIQFMLGYNIRIRLNKLPSAYEFVGIKKDYGQVNPNYTLNNDGFITITDGVLPEGMAEDTFISSVSGTYYAVFKKVLINTELVLTSNNRNNYTYKSNGYQATGRNSVYTLPKQSSVNDVLTFVRQQNLLQEELDYYYYFNKDGEQRISGDTFKITTELMDSIEAVNGNKTIRLYVKSKSKYYVTVTIDEKNGTQYLNEIKLDDTILTGTTRFVSGYYVENTELTLKISSKSPTKFSISVDGGEKKAEIQQTFKLTSDHNFIVVISKNQFKLITTEELYNDIISWKLDDPTMIQNGERFNSDIAEKSYLYNDQTNVDFVATAEKTDGKKQLTAISFADEVLSFTFNMNWKADELDSCFKVNLTDGSLLTSGVTVERDKNNGNIIILSVQIDDNIYQYSLQLTPGQDGATDKIQLSFTGSDNVSLKLTYTAVKVLGIS